MKPCPTADSYIEIFKTIHWISAPALTLTFLCCILWKIWLWTEITACRKSTCIRGRTIFLCGAERRSCSASVQRLSSAPTSWLCSTVVFLFSFSCIQRSQIKAFHRHWPAKRDPWEVVALKKNRNSLEGWPYCFIFCEHVEKHSGAFLIAVFGGTEERMLWRRLR